MPDADLQSKQGGDTYPLLCRRCETHLSVAEGAFAEQFLERLFDAQGDPIEYSPMVTRFAVSAVWRPAQSRMAQGMDIFPEMERQLENAMTVWQRFIHPLDASHDIDGAEIHFVPVVIDESDPEAVWYRDGVTEYGFRAMDHYGMACVVVKLPRLFVFGMIHDMHSAHWWHTTLNPAGGVWRPQESRFHPAIGALMAAMMSEGIERRRRWSATRARSGAGRVGSRKAKHR